MELNKKKRAEIEEQPLRLAFPLSYQHLIDQFAQYHLHSYDVKASVIAQVDGFLVLLRYGEGLSQSQQQVFEENELIQVCEELTQFYDEVAHLCKKTLIADYYKMIKP